MRLGAISVKNILKLYRRFDHCDHPSKHYLEDISHPSSVVNNVLFSFHGTTISPPGK